MAELIEGRLLRRYKRFLADVETDAGQLLTVHCPNPGSMSGLQRPGAAVRCSTSDDPRRKLRHTLEMMRVGRTWVGLHALRANAVAPSCLTLEGQTPNEGWRSTIAAGRSASCASCRLATWGT